MGRRGPAPKPTSLRKLQGNPAHRPLNDKEAKPQNSVPPRPAFVTGLAKKEWEKLAGVLAGMGLLSELDGMLFSALCIEFARYAEANRELKKEDLALTNDRGNKYSNPLVAISSTSLRLVLTLAREFGLSPAARARIVVNDGGEQEEEDLAKLLFDKVNG